MRALPVLIIALTLASCAKKLPVEHFAGATPAFNPIAFWAGHHRSWGVLENRGGEPTDTVITDCVGIPLPDGSLHMVQSLTMGDGTTTHRDWRLRRTGADTFAATANDMVGEAVGTAAGRVFHWSWVLALPRTNVTMDQWMYLYANGTMMNRTTIRKFGVVLAQVAEQFDEVK